MSSWPIDGKVKNIRKYIRLPGTLDGFENVGL
jgi:hypothetical protein